MTRHVLGALLALGLVYVTLGPVWVARAALVFVLVFLAQIYVRWNREGW